MMFYLALTIFSSENINVKVFGRNAVEMNLNKEQNKQNSKRLIEPQQTQLLQNYFDRKILLARIGIDEFQINNLDEVKMKKKTFFLSQKLKRFEKFLLENKILFLFQIQSSSPECRTN